MSATENLRQFLRDAHAKSGKGVLGFENELGFPKSSLKAVLSDQYNQVPSLDKAEKIAEALGLELYLGPPRFTDPNAPSTTRIDLGPTTVEEFETGVSQAGRVAVEVGIREGKAMLLMSPEDAKALADQLTHRAMQIEDGS